MQLSFLPTNKQIRKLRQLLKAVMEGNELANTHVFYKLTNHGYLLSCALNPEKHLPQDPKIFEKIQNQIKSIISLLNNYGSNTESQKSLLGRPVVYLAYRVLSLLYIGLSEYKNALPYLQDAIIYANEQSTEIQLRFNFGGICEQDRRLLCCLAGVSFGRKNEPKRAVDYYEQAFSKVTLTSFEYNLTGQVEPDLHQAIIQELRKITPQDSEIIKKIAEHEVKLAMLKYFDCKAVSAAAQLLVTRSGNDSLLISNESKPSSVKVEAVDKKSSETALLSNTIG